MKNINLKLVLYLIFRIIIIKNLDNILGLIYFLNK